MNTSPDSVKNLDVDALEAKNHADIRAWVLENLGGEVSGITRLERWRPQWKVSYSVDGVEQAVLVRGNRPIAPVKDLRFEMEVMQVLEAKGIKVPSIHGWVDSPVAFVMDWIETEDRDPGMIHTAIENATEMSEERWQAMLSYMDILADVHKIPVSEFTHIDYLKDRTTARDIALNKTEFFYQMGHALEIEIDPTLEFLQHWLIRNVPEHRTESSFVTGDCGQFMSDGSEVLALLDFEIANICDTHWDLACFRGRHPYENMGDIPALYRRYEQASGKKVDLPVVAYHTVAFLQMSSIAALMFMEPKTRGGNWIEGILEHTSCARRAYEAIAELKGIELDYDLHLPDPSQNSIEESGLKKLLVDIQYIPTSTAFEPWERDLLGEIPKYLLNNARYRKWFEAEAVADISEITGQNYSDLESADSAIIDVIKENNPELDAALVRILHKRTVRLSMIIAGTDPDDINPLFYKLDPILS